MHIQEGTGANPEVTRILLKQRLIRHYNATAIQFIDMAIVQALTLKHQKSLRNNSPVELEIVR